MSSGKASTTPIWSTNGIQRVYQTVYPCEEPILEPVDHRMQQQHNLAEVWRRIKSAKGTAPRSPTHPRPQEEADSICDSFA